MASVWKQKQIRQDQEIWGRPTEYEAIAEWLSFHTVDEGRTRPTTFHLHYDIKE